MLQCHEFFVLVTLFLPLLLGCSAETVIIHIGVRALSDLRVGVLFARKNYIVPECFIVEIRFLLPQNVRKKHSFTILNIF